MAGGSRAQQAIETRQRIAQTALRLIGERGYDNTSLQMIADEIGLTKAAVYYHFRTKSSILHEVTAAGVAMLADLLASASRIASKDDRLAFIVDGVVEILLAERHSMAITARDPAVRRVLRETTLSDISKSAMQVLFGDKPTPDERVAMQLAIAAPDTMPFLADIPDDELRQVLRRSLRRLLDIR
jgi:AcrR family transcriptional regulator